MQEQKRAVRLNASQFARLIKITRATSRYADRDVLVLMLGHHCGLRVTEISRITVADVMHASGKLRQEISLREAVTKGCRQRCAYLSNMDTVAVLLGTLMCRCCKRCLKARFRRQIVFDTCVTVCILGTTLFYIGSPCKLKSFSGNSAIAQG